MHTKHTNALIHESSPYLLQHAHNPVQWLPWGEKALDRAKAADKVILVSIGYSACHWCHVMERESFEDEETAAIMNAQFINIKIDREERPDIDHIYMDAVQAMTGSGGWPLNVFLTPDGRPFYGGTYFPPQRLYNRPSWKEVLLGVADAWQNRRGELEEQAAQLTAHISRQTVFVQQQPAFTGDTLPDNTPALLEAVLRSADREEGGFGSAPKFPQTFTIRLLLQAFADSGSREALDQALLSLDKMLAGGIYDHIGGGLARYSTDQAWLVPHFEKMLYDQALLLTALCDAWLITRADRYRDAVYEIAAFLREELRHPEGGFYAALDADSEGEEGKYYVWEAAEVQELLGKDAGLLCRFYDITPEGNWEGKNIPRILQPSALFAAENGLDPAAFRDLCSRGKAILKKARSARVRPGLDDKLLLGWNALAVEALAKAATVFNEPAFADMAAGSMRFLRQSLCTNGQPSGWMHTWKDGKARIPAFLEDYACLASACISLYEWDFSPQWLEMAHGLTQHVLQHFSDEEGVFFYFTPAGQQDVILRKKEIYDGATPSGNSVMAIVLFRLGTLLGETDWCNRAIRMTASMQEAVLKYPGSFGLWAQLYLLMQNGSTELAVIGPGADSTARNILSKYYMNYPAVMAAAEPDPQFPLLNGRKVGEPPLIYRCRRQTCDAPVTDPAKLFGEPGNLKGD